MYKFALAFLTLAASHSYAIDFQVDMHCDDQEAHIHQLPSAPLRILLSEVYPLVEGVVPSDQDYAFVMALIQPYIQELMSMDNIDFEQVLTIGVERLSRLYYSDQLTIEQKAALYNVMLNYANSLDNA